MKKISTVLAIALSVYIFRADATILTCSSSQASPGMYSSLQTAINNASVIVRDTILVAGSPLHYGVVNVDRAVCIIGTGFNPQKQNPLKSSIQYLVFTNANASNSVLMGLNFIVQPSSSVRTDATNITNITIKRCLLSNPLDALSLNCTNWLIEGCILNNGSFIGGPGIAINSANGWVIRNNIICTIGGEILQISGIPSADVNVYNNVFMASNPTADAFLASNSAIIIVSNNIFWHCSPNLQASNVVNNNLSFEGFSTTIAGNGFGNLENTNPQFTNVGIAQYNWSAGSDFHLVGTSPGHNAGIDGTDIGIYGALDGGLFLQSGEPDIPQVTLFDITGSNSVSPGGTLNIHVTSTRHQ